VRAGGGAEVWWLFIAMAAITVALRASFIVLQDRIRVPDVLRHSLAYVPAAVLAAIVAPAFIDLGAGDDVLTHAPRWAAGAVGVVAALVTRNMLVVLAVGMLAFWGVRALVG
jgi:branched-subunit amino acid transport protein